MTTHVLFEGKPDVGFPTWCCSIGSNAVSSVVIY